MSTERPAHHCGAGFRPDIEGPCEACLEEAVGRAPSYLETEGERIGRMAAELGRRGGLKGGKATGASKRRGDSAYYRALGAKRKPKSQDEQND